ncbi:MAG: hypothetical protein K2X55_20855 [Burkholderiaceae bacterium]|nr:hypothetical protein [Burkholderiaceae bacterium]
MLILTTDTHPQGLQPQATYSMVLVNKAIEISNKGIRGLFEKQVNEYDEALSFLAQNCPDEANAIIGVKISTTAQQFSNGTFLYMTIVGTPVKY